MTTSTLNHAGLVEKLFQFTSRRAVIGHAVGESDFVIATLQQLTFLQPAGVVLNGHEFKSAKYTNLQKLQPDTSLAPASQDIAYLLKYVHCVRGVQMLETYIEQVALLCARVSEMTAEQINQLAGHVKNVTLLTADAKPLQIIAAYDKNLLAKFNLPQTITAQLPAPLSLLLPRISSADNSAYDQQNNADYLQHSLVQELSQFNPQQQAGLRINRAVVQGNNTDYLTALNTFLADYQLSGVADIQLGAANVLTTLRFEPVASEPAAQQDFVSIIMSCFNAADTVEYAVRSLLQQTHGHFELLVCDDNSTDNSLAILQRIASEDARVVVYQSKANQGTYNIRNSLLQQAKGEYITFHDSDDVAHPQRLAEQLNHLTEKQLLVSSGRWVRVAPEGNFTFFFDGLFMRFCVVSTMVHRSVFNRVPKFRSSFVSADTEFYENCLLLLGHDKVAVLDKPLVFGLWGDGSLTQIAQLKAGHNGFVAAPRRAYSEITARQRMLGAQVVSDDQVDNVLKQQHIYRQPTGVALVFSRENTAAVQTL